MVKYEYLAKAIVKCSNCQHQFNWLSHKPHMDPMACPNCFKSIDFCWHPQTEGKIMFIDVVAKCPHCSKEFPISGDKPEPVIYECPQCKKDVQLCRSTIIDNGCKGCGKCFIATAAYGSPIAPQVAFLRNIRDKGLRKTRIGTIFIDAYEWVYYKFSPYVAEVMIQRRSFKTFMKWVVVNPIVYFLMGIFKIIKRS